MPARAPTCVGGAGARAQSKIEKYEKMVRERDANIIELKAEKKDYLCVVAPPCLATGSRDFRWRVCACGGRGAHQLADKTVREITFLKADMCVVRRGANVVVVVVVVVAMVVMVVEVAAMVTVRGRERERESESFCTFVCMCVCVRVCAYVCLEVCVRVIEERARASERASRSERKTAEHDVEKARIEEERAARLRELHERACALYADAFPVWTPHSTCANPYVPRPRAGEALESALRDARQGLVRAARRLCAWLCVSVCVCVCARVRV